MQMELDQVCGEYLPTLNHRSRSVSMSSIPLSINKNDKPVGLVCHILKLF